MSIARCSCTVATGRSDHLERDIDLSKRKPGVRDMSENFFLFQVVILKSTVSAVNHHPRILHPHWLVGVPGQLLALPLSFISTGICCCKAAILYSFPFKNKMSGLLRNVFFAVTTPWGVILPSCTCRNRSTLWPCCGQSTPGSFHCQSLPGGRPTTGRTWAQTPEAPWTGPTRTKKTRTHTEV